MGVKGWCSHFVQSDGGRSALGEAAAHAPPARRGARSTPRSYAPMESSGNGCLRQPMQTFFYCDSHESQQRGKTPRVKFWSNISKNISDQFSRHFRQFGTTLVFFILDEKYFFLGGGAKYPKTISDFFCWVPMGTYMALKS